MNNNFTFYFKCNYSIQRSLPEKSFWLSGFGAIDNRFPPNFPDYKFKGLFQRVVLIILLFPQVHGMPFVPQEKLETGRAGLLSLRMKSFINFSISGIVRDKSPSCMNNLPLHHHAIILPL